MKVVTCRGTSQLLREPTACLRSVRQHLTGSLLRAINSRGVLGSLISSGLTENLPDEAVLHAGWHVPAVGFGTTAIYGLVASI